MDTIFEKVIDQLLRQFSRVEAQILEGDELSDLSMKQMVYLEAIARLDKPSYTDLARELKVSKPSVTAIISKLMQKGYLTRSQSAKDLRMFHLILTEKGQKIQSAHEDVHRKIAAYFTARLDPNEVTDLGRILSKIL
jgi:DNA-binding MarR family transcriptional regulator